MKLRDTRVIGASILDSILLSIHYKRFYNLFQYFSDKLIEQGQIKKGPLRMRSSDRLSGVFTLNASKTKEKPYTKFINIGIAPIDERLGVKHRRIQSSVVFINSTQNRRPFQLIRLKRC